ncbi:hypothetical protein IC620_03595 [Hazenella sp. IB182357]|uniref:Uncharacterized protein n=1 Tax=Polycladospora coralii TaxID=2771432 RepID=A0A926N895_9BACL|nr:hypothetical protein [Polycladospora coralii]MBD1371438.1 hypothetical protein [Polycladospora coralii]
MMHSWVIGRMILRTWMNRWWAVTKQSPVFGILPVLIFLSLMGIFLYMYDLSQDGLMEMLGVMELEAIFPLLENFALFSFIVVMVGLILLWQWVTNSGVLNRFMETLPVFKRSWAVGHLIPVMVLLISIFICLLFPTLLTLLKPFSFSVSKWIFIMGSFIMLLLLAVLLGLIWQQMIHLVTRWILKNRSANTHRIFHSFLFLFSIMIVVGGITQLYQKQILPYTYLPSYVFKEIVYSLYIDRGNAFIQMSGLLFSLFVSGLMLYWLFQREREWEPDDTNRWIPLKGLPFGQQQWLSIASLELKRIARDYETHLYTMIFLLFFITIGQLIPLAEDIMEPIYRNLYGKAIFYGLPFILSVYPLTSRNKNKEMRSVYYTLPLHLSKFTWGKIFVYGMIFPIISTLLMLCMLLFFQQSFPSLSMLIESYVYSTVMYTVAYSVGVLFPGNQTFVSTLVMNLLYVTISLPVVFLMQYLVQTLSMPWLILEVVFMLILLVLLTTQLEKRRVMIN